MAYGLEIYDENGNLRLDASDMLSRIIYTFDIAQGASGTHTMPFTPDWTKCDILAQALSFPVHQLTKSGNQITYSLNGIFGAGPTRVIVYQYK
jgi:hypothetical protein